MCEYLEEEILHPAYNEKKKKPGKFSWLVHETNLSVESQ